MKEYNLLIFLDRRFRDKGSGTAKRYDLIRVGEVLLEEVCHCIDEPLGLIYAPVIPTKSDRFLLAAHDIEVLRISTNTLAHHNVNGLNSDL